MIWKIVLVLGLAVGLNGDEEAVSEQKVTIHHPKHSEIISQGGDKQENHKDYEWSYPSYEFSYKVKDPHTHDIKGQKEERDGDKVKGDYWLIEPTGRKRTVKYHADDEIGFNAHVDYTKSEYALKEKNVNNQVEGRRVNSQEDEQLEVQKKDNDYKVTEGNWENENNNENGENENSGDQRGNIQEAGTSQNQNENGGADLIEQNENNNNNNENQLPVNDAMVTLEALNENVEPQCNCKCNERRQIDYRNNINEVKNKNNNNGGQEITTRRKRKNMNRSINLKSEVNGESMKQIDTAEKKHNTKLSHSDENKKSQNNNLNDKRKKTDSADFGSRNGKRKQIQTRDQNKYEDQQRNNTNTVKHDEIKEIKETKSENINENDNDRKYQHRILIHHPKIVAQKASKKS